MTTEDLSAIIYLGLLVLAIYGVAWCMDTFFCTLDPQEAAWDETAKALDLANRDLEQRDRLKLVKE